MRHIWKTVDVPDGIRTQMSGDMLVFSLPDRYNPFEALSTK